MSRVLTTVAILGVITVVACDFAGGSPGTDAVADATDDAVVEGAEAGQEAGADATLPDAPADAEADAPTTEEVSPDLPPEAIVDTPTDVALEVTEVIADTSTEIPDNPCPGPNPQGCTPGGCPEGQACVPVDACHPSACACDPVTKTWACTPDCMGGACVPECAGLDPGPCDDPGLACLGCPASGVTAQERHLCTTPCKADPDCIDPARPMCNQAGPGQAGMCTPDSFFCCWLCA
jgi:hypothetical protein